jgi:hypothetical protein
MTTLDAINQMLAGIGEAPVTTVDAGNPEIDTALLTLEQATREVQQERWRFNQEFDYPIVPDTNGNLIVPPNVLFISQNQDNLRDRLYDLVVRQGKLYDKRSHSFIFNETVTVTIVWAFPFEELPDPFQHYVAARASRVFAARSQGSREIMQMIAIDEERLRGACIAYDSDVSELNMLQDWNGRNSHRPYTPFDAVWRA